MVTGQNHEKTGKFQTLKYTLVIWEIISLLVATEINLTDTSPRLGYANEKIKIGEQFTGFCDEFHRRRKYEYILGFHDEDQHQSDLKQV